MISQGEAYACCNLGVLHHRQRRHEEALTHFERFFEAARLLKDQKVLDVARVNLGTVRAALNFTDYVQVRACHIVVSYRANMYTCWPQDLTQSLASCVAGGRYRSTDTAVVEEHANAPQRTESGSIPCLGNHQ